MNLSFSARIEGREIHCEIGTDIAISGAVFCCSLFTPSLVVSGGVLETTIGELPAVTAAAVDTP